MPPLMVSGQRALWVHSRSLAWHKDGFADHGKIADHGRRVRRAASPRRTAANGGGARWLRSIVV